jgi:hypothetical protein
MQCCTWGSWPCWQLKRADLFLRVFYALLKSFVAQNIVGKAVKNTLKKFAGSFAAENI